VPDRSARARSSEAIRFVSSRPGRTPFTVTPSGMTSTEIVLSHAASALRQAFE